MEDRTSVKLMELAEIVYELGIKGNVDFANVDIDEADRIGIGEWCRIERVDFFETDNRMYVIGYWGGEANARLYHISAFDEHIGDFCMKEMPYRNRTKQNCVNCIGKMIADFLIDYEGRVNDVLTVENIWNPAVD